MKEKILIVEDQFVEADYLRLMLIKAGYSVLGIARSVLQAQTMIEKERPDIVLLDIFLKGKLTGIDLGKQLMSDNIAFVYLSANSNEEVLSVAKATQPYGFLVKPFREKDLLVTLEIVRYRHEQSRESKLLKESRLQDQLKDIIKSEDNWDKKILAIGRMIQPYIPFDYLAAGPQQTGDNASHAISYLRVGFDEYQPIHIPELLMMTGIAVSELTALIDTAVSENEALFYNDDVFQQMIRETSLMKLLATTFNMQSYLTMPLHLPGGGLFNFCFYSRRSDAYLPAHLELVSGLEHTWAKVIGTIMQKDKLKAMTKDPHKLLPASDTFFDGIVGRSHLLLNVFDHISIVAPSDTSVLILGESGTGKERIADCIHELSPRKKYPLIKVNCAALPPSLIESALFGHEKGAFTGAADKRIGKFEMADNGTIFLDEIGDMPVELQTRLLRVLQEKEIERLGSRTQTRVNVRVIAATNRNLEKEVAEGRFRLDLYYRLNVFPIIMPPLRERREDIPVLADHFIKYYNRKTGRKISGLSDKTLRKLMAYNWPGNIRELEHLIERSVLLAKGTVIEDVLLPVIGQKEQSTVLPEVRMKTIQENERDHIMEVLKKCNGRIWGEGAAAEVLNVPPSTLKSKMKKLGIKREYIK